MTNYAGTMGSLTVGLRGNNVTRLPAMLFNGVGSMTPASDFNSVLIDVSENPITYVDAGVFMANRPTTLRNVSLNMSYPTAGVPVTFPSLFTFSNGTFDPFSAALELYLANTSAKFSVFSALRNFPPPINNYLGVENPIASPWTLGSSNGFLGAALRLDLRYNNITECDERTVPSAMDDSTFSVGLTFVKFDLSHNQLRSLTNATFASTRLRAGEEVTLDVSYNQITYVSIFLSLSLHLSPSLSLSLSLSLFLSLYHCLSFCLFLSLPRAVAVSPSG